MTSPPDHRPARVLVVVASRHGATREIADAVGGVLRAAGIDVRVEDAESAPGPEGWDALVLGGAVYYGRWLPAARAFAKKHGAALAELPVWLFSSGPVGDQRRTDGGPSGPHPRELIPGARDHVVFGGRIERRLLGVRERAVARVVRADDGDFRDWEDIARWADGIADELRVPAAR